MFPHVSPNPLPGLMVSKFEFKLGHFSNKHPLLERLISLSRFRGGSLLCSLPSFFLARMKVDIKGCQK